MTNCNLIIKGKYVLPMDRNLSVIKDGMVIASENKILDIGKQSELENLYKADEIIDVGNSIIMPGLINTHTHAAMSYFRGLADDLPLNKWLEKHIWPAEAKFVKPDFIKKASELACLEMIKSGITCFNDMYFFQEETAKVVQKIGMWAILGEVILNFQTPSCQTPGETINKILKLIDKFRENEFVDIAFAPHSIYACNEKVLNRVKELAEENNIAVHIHISETKKEVEDCEKEHNKSPVAYLDKIGFLSDRVIAAHSVWLNENDLEIYKNRGVKVSHCPISNMKLASGIAPLVEMLGHGIAVGLGTDGVASNNALDLFSEMRICALLHKVNKLNPMVMNARKVVKMATVDGAKALGLNNKIGSLEVGKSADIITINLDKPHLIPIYNPYAHLVYCAGAQDVNNVIINGKVVMENREVKTINEEKILKEAEKFKIK
ncbi:MAG: amidohydrolase [Patescibacteria group bacterium]|nr:amidohydrolase [Patescibacteria group bacterium]